MADPSPDARKMKVTVRFKEAGKHFRSANPEASPDPTSYELAITVDGEPLPAEAVALVREQLGSDEFVLRMHNALEAATADQGDVTLDFEMSVNPATGSRLASTPLMEDPTPLTAPRIRSRKMLAPGTMQILFNVCESSAKDGFIPFIDGAVGGMEFAHGKDALQLRHPEEVPLDLRNANIEREALEVWASAGVRRDLERLDAIAFDVAALAVTAFYARTKAETVDSRFPLMVDDYLDWKGMDPRNRTDAVRQEVLDRINLVCSERFHVFSETSLHLPNPETGRKKKQPFVVKGPFLVRAGELYRNGQRQLQLEGLGRPDGVLLSLGEWARKFVEEKAMLGVFLKRLAEYDLRRQQWERRIGWYLVFQLQNMASKSKWKTGKNGAVMIAPQHALKMRTVLDGARVDWEELSRVNPGRLIKYWLDALSTLQKDGILAEWRCLDGSPDGSDLPQRGRLDKMLERRWIFIPGAELSKHLQPKHAAAEKGQKAAARFREKTSSASR
jgi:hypothetical protein